MSYDRNRYNQLKAGRWCVDCAKEKAEAGKVRCASCLAKGRDRKSQNEYNRGTYQWYKEMGICVSCGEYTAAPGRVRCEVCLAKNAERKTKSKSGDRKKLRDKRREDGLCIFCGKPLAQDSKCYCIECRTKNRQRMEKRKDGIDRSDRPKYGLCYCCGAKINGGSLCEKCKAKSIKNLPKPDKDGAWYKYHKQQNQAIFGVG